MAIADIKEEKEKKVKPVKSRKKGGSRNRGKYPTKRTINLANQGEKPIRLGIAVPAIILILVAAAAISKFFVIDRMTEVAEAQRVVSELQAQVNAGYAELSNYDDTAELYAHYTYSGFTTEELERANRVAVMRLIRTTVLPWARVSNWNVSGNRLSINLSGESLQQLNLIAQQLMQQDIVDYCTVNTASAKDVRGGGTSVDELGLVQGQMQVFLNSKAGVNAG